MEETKTIQLFIPPSFEGVIGVATIESMLNEGVSLNVNYTTHLDFRDTHLFKDSAYTIVLGLAYMGYTLPPAFYSHMDVPFVEFVQIATYGAQIEGKHLHSEVTLDSDPVGTLYSYLTNPDSGSIISKLVAPTDTTRHLVDVANKYRTWTWYKSSVVKILLSLYHAGHKRLPEMIQGLTIQEMMKNYSPIVKGQLTKIEEYIEGKVVSANMYNVEIDDQVCQLYVVFAENHINELAHRILEESASDFRGPVIVCVGRPTKGEDLFSIRTRGIDASKIAHCINKGQGKEDVATVFSGVSYAELMGNSIMKQLSEHRED